MVMGTGIRDLRGMTSGFRHDQLFSTTHFKSGGPAMLDTNSSIDLPNSPFNPTSSGPTSSSVPTADATTSTSFTPSAEADSAEDSEIFSDIVLSYISQMLMEEDMDDKFEQFQEHPALLAAEKPFYDILAENHSPPSDQPPLYSINHNHSSESPDDSVHNHYGSFSGSSSVVVDGSWPCDSFEYQQLQTHPASVDYSSQSSFSSSNSVGNVVEGLDEYFLKTLAFPDLLTQSQPAWEQFRKGVEEARKFLPGEDKLVIDVEAGGFSLPQEPRRENRLREVKAEKEEREYPSQGSRGRKNRHSDDDLESEGRSNKQTAVFPEQTVRTAMFDMVLLHNEACMRGPSELRAAMQKEASKSSLSNHSRGSGKGGRGKRQPKREVVDLRTILVHCAQAVATDDRRNAGELLKQIRQHSSPHGDASQRLAHYFADGLQARLAGTGSQIYNSLVAKRTCATDILKAYHLYMAACPFKKISHFFSNQTILDVVEKATRVHIIDYGIYYGFQWPCFLQRLSSRPGGPPSLRITGIDLPQPGFRPTERIEETGRRLADYCRSFSIPFEYHAIAAKWEDVRVEDLNIDKDEAIVVNCLYRLRNVMDETVAVDSPRNKVLNTIRKMNPDVFIHGIVNGCYGAPFFVTRFREALFHFSALFDMLETNVPREDAQRLLIERDLFGREVLNVISCEGLERVERPETYKQWQMRNLRAGFAQLPLKPEIMKKARDKVNACYHKDFVVDEDSGWLLQGWKGRIIYALSTWKPNDAS